MSLSSSSFEKASSPVQTQTGLGPRVHPFSTPGCCTCLNQMLAVIVLSQHRVSSSKIVRLRVSFGARCMGHAFRTWSAVCSVVPHMQLDEGSRPQLCINKWNRPTPVLKRLSLTQAARDKPIPTGLAPFLGTKKIRADGRCFLAA